MRGRSLYFINPQMRRLPMPLAELMSQIQELPKIDKLRLMQ